MVKALTDAGWYQLLTDLDQYEDYCNMGYFGAPHVDFIQAAKLYLDKRQEAHFHFKKLQLFQKIPTHHPRLYDIIDRNDVGPFSALMFRYMTGQAWVKLMYYVSRDTKECEKAGKRYYPHHMAVFLYHGNKKILESLTSGAIKHLTESKWTFDTIAQSDIKNETGLEEMAQYLNSRMTDSHWQRFLTGLYHMEHRYVQRLTMQNQTCKCIVYKYNSITFVY